MLYFVYEWLARSSEHVPLLNLLKYLTFRTGMSMLTAYVVAVAMGSRFIRWMKAKQGRGQPIRTDGIERHVLEKSGTPTMGGFMILAGLFVGSLLWADLRNIHVWVVLGITGGYGILGFLDDYAKVTKQTSAGLSSVQKLVAQFIIAIIATVVLILFAPRAPLTPGLETSVVFPFFKALVIDLGWFYVAFAAVTIAGFSNAVNLTDGLDGLAIVPVMIAAAAFGLITYLIGNVRFADYLQVHYIPGTGELAIIRVGAHMPQTPGLETSIAFPGLKELLWNVGWFYVVFGMVVIGGFSNAVNLTAGLDGLAIVPVMIAAAAFGFIAYLIGNIRFADYLQVHYVAGT
ncbi:MAG: phospho-N-acetylmuramoyl-pentapeptide-transferase, partial [Caulobacter sp.]|nr:phospho-N-acetylmuramoyl-pentapeptide-transferase [Caulobacter sp.]